MTQEDGYRLAVLSELLMKYTARRLEQLDRRTRLGADLGMDGDDADEFMAEFFQRLQVDPSGFVLSDYFGTEGCANPWVWLFGKKRSEIAIGDLIAAARRRRWVQTPKEGEDGT